MFTSFGYKDSLVFFIPKYISQREPNKTLNYIKITVYINSLSLLIISLFLFINDTTLPFKFLNHEIFNIYRYHFLFLLIITSFLAIGVEIINGFEKIHLSVCIEKFLKPFVKILFAFFIYKYRF